MSDTSKNFRPNYLGAGSDIFKLACITGFLTVITLGIYRFWAKTRVRRFIWSSVRIDGDSAEYTGTGLEKLLGFLVAVVVLAIYLGILQVLLSFVGFSVLGSFAEPNPSPEQIIAQVAAAYITVFAVLPLVFFAQYRGRRYMLSRTRWRGLRLGMTPGALGYMLRACMYLILTILTLGILLPLQTFKLQKYMVDRQWFGDAQFSQNGKWTALYPMMKHFLIGIGIFILASAVIGGLQIIGLGMLLMIIAYFWLIYGGVYFRVMSYRYLTDNQVLDGRITFQTTTSVVEIVKLYILGGLLVGVVAIAAFLPIGLIAGDLFQSIAMGGTPASLIVIAVLYLVALVVINGATLALITQPVFAHFVTTTTVQEAQHLTAIEQRAADSMPDADGFADALDVGGAF
ncbi:MAG: DUF898 family protein [Pseudomonadota bacterium]